MTDMDRFIAAADALADAAKDAADGWDWWQKDEYNRCQSVPGDAIYDMRAALTAYRAARDAITPGTPPAFTTSA